MQPLANMKIVVNEISIRKNKVDGKEFNLSYQISRNVEEINENQKNVELVLSITNSQDNPFPFDIRVSITGAFDVTQIKECAPDSLADFLNVQSVQILYPYLRSIVSTITTTSFMPPIILPIIDAKQFFSNEGKNKESTNNE